MAEITSLAAIPIMAVTTDRIVPAITRIVTGITIKNYWGAIGLIINMKNHHSIWSIVSLNGRRIFPAPL